MRKTVMLGIVFIAVLLGSPASALAVDRNWVGDLDDEWNVDGNWSPVGVPQPGDTVYLGGTDTGQIVRLSGTAASVARVYGGKRLIVSGTTLTLTGSPDVTSFEGAEVTDNGTLQITGGGTYQGLVTLGETDGMPSPGKLSLEASGIKLSGTIVEKAAGLGTTTIAPAAAVTVEASKVLIVASRLQNRGSLHTDGLASLSPSAAELMDSDGAFSASATGDFLVRPAPGSTFTLASTSSVTGAGTFEVLSLSAGGGTVRVEEDATFTPGTLVVQGASRLELETDAEVLTAEFRGATTATSGRFGAGRLEVTGSATSLLQAGRLGGGTTVFEGPVLMEVASDASYLGLGATLRTNGPTEWRQGGMQLNGGTWINAGRLSITNTTGTTSLSGPGELRNLGTGVIDKSEAGQFLGSGSLSSGGTINVVSGRFGSDVPAGNFGALEQFDGTVTVSPGATLDKRVLLSGGVFKGGGTVRSLDNQGGTVEPGMSPGTLTVAETFFQASGGLIRMEIDGTAPGAFDVLAVNGKAFLGGALLLAGSHVPAAGEQFRLVRATERTGQWEEIVGVPGYGASYQADGMTLCGGACAATPSPSPSPTATPVPTATPTPTPTPTPTAAPTAVATASPAPAMSPAPPPPAPTATPAPRLTAASVISLPSATRCVSKRSLRIKLLTPKGQTLKKATFTVNAKRVKTVTGAALRKPVDLRSLPRGKYTVKVAVGLVDGRSFTASRRYKACAGK